MEGKKKVDLERAKRMCRTFIDGKPIYEILPQMFRDMSSGEISRCIGVTRGTVAVWAKLLGLSHSEETLARIKSVRTGNIALGNSAKKKKLYQGLTIPEIVSRYFPSLSSREISDRFGCSASYVRTVARELGVKHSKETEKRITALRLSCRSYHPMNDEEKQKWLEKRRKMLKTERWRQDSGLPRRTKIRFSVLTAKQKNAKHTLCALRNYFSDCSIDPYALFYDEQTVRHSPKYRYDEGYYEKKYGLRFLPADGCEEETTR